MSAKNIKEVKEADYILSMMEDVFGHRITSWSPKDTIKLHKKLSQPTTDYEKEKYVKTVEPLMNKKSIIPKKKDAFLDSFVDMDTRVNPDSYSGGDDRESDELNKLLGIKL